MLNNIKLLVKAFDKIYEIEKKVNYEFEPIFSRRKKDWKRSLYYDELKNDFFKDVSEFGFCPYLPKTCNEQQKNKNISKLAKVDNYSKLDYIKSLYKNIDKNEINKKKSNNIFFKLNEKKIKNYILTSNRMRKNKSSIDIDFKKNKKLFLKNMNNFKSMEWGEGNPKLKKSISTLNDINKINSIYKKDKIINKSDNEFAEAESFNYEPEKTYFTHNKNYTRENDKYEEETNVPKNYTLFNNHTTNQKNKKLEISNKKMVINHPFNYFKKLKGAFSDKNKNKKYKYDILNKYKELERYLKKPKIIKKDKGDKEFKLLAYSRKIKYE